MALTKVTGSVIKDSVSLSGNVSVGGTLTYQDVTNVDALGVGTFRAGINISGGQLDVGSNIKIGTAGVITATTFSGSVAASNLTGTIPTARLGSGTANNTTFLRGDSTFQTVVTDLVNDSSPQLGGDLDTNSNHILLNDTAQLKMGASNDFILRHNGTDNTLGGNATTKFFNPLLEIYKLDGTKKAAAFNPDGSTELYFNNSKKLETTSSGVTCTATLTSSAVHTTASQGAVSIGGGGDIRLANGSWTGDHAGKIQHANNFLYFQGGTGSYAFIFRDPGGANRLYIDENGHVLPSDNNTYDLGSTAKGWRNVYMNDLNLSNMKGDTNDVDGTQGSWTIQEGKDDLYIINRLNGKKFKIKMEEIS